MKALSIKQPWSWLIVNGHKDIENRDWPTRFTGPVLIHAGKSFDRHGYDYVRRHFPDIKMPLPDEFPVGGIVGEAQIVDCVNYSDSDWFVGEWGFVLTDCKPRDFVPFRGQLGFFEVNL